MDDWPNAFGLHDTPNEECDSSSWGNDCLECEKVPTGGRNTVSLQGVIEGKSFDVHFVDREPDCRE